MSMECYKRLLSVPIPQKLETRSKFQNTDEGKRVGGKGGGTYHHHHRDPKCPIYQSRPTLLPSSWSSEPSPPFDAQKLNPRRFRELLKSFERVDLPVRRYLPGSRLYPNVAARGAHGQLSISTS